jgi:hypothetical protein
MLDRSRADVESILTGLAKIDPKLRSVVVSHPVSI